MKKISIHCPVDVYVYDKNGILCGTIIDNQADSNYQEVFLFANGDDKFVYLLGDSYNIKLISTDVGSMKYDIEEYLNDELVRTVTTADVPLNIGLNYESFIPDILYIDNDVYELTSDIDQSIQVDSDSYYTDDYELEDAKVIGSGSCGNNAIWKVYSNGLMEITGTGPINDYSGMDLLPWNNFRSNIKYIVIKDGITSIGKFAFGWDRIHTQVYCGLDQLKSIEIADTVTSIGEHAFHDCPNLKSITIGAGLKDIGKYAFSYSNSLEYIYVNNQNQYFTSEDNILYSKDKETIYRYPHNGKENITILDGVTTLYFDSFGDINTLIHINLPKSLISLKDYAFSGCDELREIIFTGPAPNIDQKSFDGVTATAYYPSEDSSWTSDVKQNYGGKIEWKAFDGSSHVHSYTYSDNYDGTHTKSCTAGDDTSIEKHTYQDGTCTLCGAEELIDTIDLSSCKMSLSEVEYTYDGTEKEPTVTIANGDQALKEGTDYTVTYSNNVNAGTASVSAKGKGNYTGTITKTFTIKKADQEIRATISSANLVEKETATIEASAATGALSYSSSDIAVATVDEDGVVTAVSIGTATITITAEGNENYNPATTAIKITVTEKSQPHTHEYGDPIFEWAEDYSCKAIFTCKDKDDEQTLDCTVTSKVTNPTCTKDGKTVYTATVEFNGRIYTDIKTVPGDPATGHSYEYTDNGDGTHTATCVNGDDSFMEDHIFKDGVCICGAKWSESPSEPESPEDSKPAEIIKPWWKAWLEKLFGDIIKPGESENQKPGFDFLEWLFSWLFE